MVKLKDETHRFVPEPRPLRIRQREDVVSVYMDRSAGRPVQPSQDVKQGALSDAGRADHRKHLAARDDWTEIEHDEAHVTYPGPWARLSKTPISIRHRAPRIGEHNFYVYGNLLGLSDDEIMQLSDEGVI